MIPRKIMYESDEGKLYDHFLVDIVGHDRYLRFGYEATNDNIMSYLEKAFKDFGDTNMWFIVQSGDRIVGSVHVIISDNDVAEMGFTVSPQHRGEGLGQELFQRAATWAMMKGAKTLYTQCLSENQVMQHIAKKNGMTVVTIGYGEKEATINASKGTIQSYFDDRFFDGLAFVDQAITTQKTIIRSLMRL
jgi:RimJ/RimL family protein N-acetyltransferase